MSDKRNPHRVYWESHKVGDPIATDIISIEISVTEYVEGIDSFDGIVSLNGDVMVSTVFRATFADAFMALYPDFLKLLEHADNSHSKDD